MSGPTLTSGIAVPFAWTSAGAGLDLSISFPSGTSPVGVTIASGTYYVCLASSGADFLRVVQSAINAAVAGAGRSEVFTLTLTATGYTYIESTGVFSATATPAMKLLGFGALTSTLSATSTYPPAYLATFVERVSADWTPRTATSGAETLAGVGYGVYSGSWREEDEIAFGFIPRDPSQRTSLAVDQTPWMPDGDWSATMALPRVWTCRDLLENAGGKTLHVALGNLQTLRTSTTARYDLCTLPFSEIATPRKARLREGWNAYFRWTTKMLRQSTQTGTRA